MIFAEFVIFLVVSLMGKKTSSAIRWDDRWILATQTIVKILAIKVLVRFW